MNLASFSTPLEKIRVRVHLSNDTLNCFQVKYPKFARFYFPPRIHKRLHNVPGRPVITNCGFYAENISSFIDQYMEPVAQKKNLFIKKQKQFFLGKIKSLSQLVEGTVLCIIDVVGLYLNVLAGEDLTSFKRFLDARMVKKVIS